jgi:hypothetical protein
MRRKYKFSKREKITKRKLEDEIIVWKKNVRYFNRRPAPIHTRSFTRRLERRRQFLQNAVEIQPKLEEWLNLYDDNSGVISIPEPWLSTLPVIGHLGSLALLDDQMVMWSLETKQLIEEFGTFVIAPFVIPCDYFGTTPHGKYKDLCDYSSILMPFIYHVLNDCLPTWKAIISCH